MRYASALALALFAAVAVAQPIVGPEVISDPLALRFGAVSLAAPAVAMARDSRGVAVAWSMGNAEQRDRIYVARLDAAGHVAGAIREIATVPRTVPVDALYPSIAARPSGNGFTLAWIESLQRNPAMARAAYCRLDGDLNASPSNELQGESGAASSPAVVRSGSSTWVTAGGDVWEIKDDGAVTGPARGAVPASDMTLGPGDAPLLVGSVTSKSTSYTCSPGCAVVGGPFNGYCYEQCRNYYDTVSYTMALSSPNSAAATKTFSFHSEAQPSIASDGKTVLVVWFDGAQDSGGSVVAARLPQASLAEFAAAAQQPLTLGQFAPDPGPKRADIATDGQRYLVVWRARNGESLRDIAGAVVDRDGKVTPLSIAASASDERDPSVTALGNGLFLVAYETFGLNAQRRIAGRLVSFPRRVHAVR